jgi:hypothetical protein
MSAPGASRQACACALQRLRHCGWSVRQDLGGVAQQRPAPPGVGARVWRGPAHGPVRPAPATADHGGPGWSSRWRSSLPAAGPGCCICCASVGPVGLRGLPVRVQPRHRRTGPARLRPRQCAVGHGALAGSPPASQWCAMSAGCPWPAAWAPSARRRWHQAGGAAAPSALSSAACTRSWAEAVAAFAFAQHFGAPWRLQWRPALPARDSPQAPASRVGVKGSVASAAASSSRRTGLGLSALHPCDDGVAHAVGHGQFAVVLGRVVKRASARCRRAPRSAIAQAAATGAGSRPRRRGCHRWHVLQPLRKAVWVAGAPESWLAPVQTRRSACQRQAQHTDAAPACLSSSARSRTAASVLGQFRPQHKDLARGVAAAARPGHARCSAMKPSSARLASSARCQSSMHDGVKAARRQGAAMRWRMLRRIGAALRTEPMRCGLAGPVLAARAPVPGAPSLAGRLAPGTGPARLRSKARVNDA